MPFGALSHGVNHDALGGHLLLINHSLVREVAHHIIGLLLCGVRGVKSHLAISIVKSCRELGSRVNGKLALAGVHSVHRGHHHLHVLLLLEVVASIVVRVTLILVVVHRHLVHVILEHHLLVVLLEEGVSGLGKVSSIGISRHRVTTSSAALAESTTAVTTTSLMVLVTRHRA